MHSEAVKALKTPDFADQLAALGADPIGSTPQELAKFMAAEIARWSQLIEKANIRAD